MVVNDESGIEAEIVHSLGGIIEIHVTYICVLVLGVVIIELEKFVDPCIEFRGVFFFVRFFKDFGDNCSSLIKFFRPIIIGGLD